MLSSFMHMSYFTLELFSSSKIPVDPQIWSLKKFFSFVGSNPTLKGDKGERPPFPYKRGALPPWLKKEC